MVPKAKASSSKKKDKDKDEDEILDMDDADDHDGDPSDLEAIAATASTAKAKKIASKDVGDTTATGENGTPEISRPEVEAPFGFTKAGRPRKRPGPAPGTKRGAPRPVSLSPPRFDDNGELMPRRSPTPEPLNLCLNPACRFRTTESPPVEVLATQLLALSNELRLRRGWTRRCRRLKSLLRQR
jgi:hypothetical protein